ncbi:uncharacterized protein LOC125863066 isoform X2 [Solanum stenotomum]|uniref:uncharacterized protein LOC125863066 isoform X2 n=1 Tax=Solanum stenotomum TaxID=172797 RepID=UPI0020D1C132|nr:uncharacterized protein LOC125863066 isoform X2 [Solanum stenotomum]
MMEKFLPVGRFDDFRCSGDSILLLSGPPSSGKTSLVFQFAINSATATAGNVVFICNRRKLESKPPYLAQGIDASSDVINRIQMKNCQERYNNTRGRDLAMVLVLALCRNAILCANEKGSCQLLLSDTHNGDSPRLLYLYKRWVSSIYIIKEDGFGSYLIRSLGVAKYATTKLAKYSIALQYLVYEGITKDGEQSDE